ncbi:MAG: response regulator [Cytophagaceae bacterium]
MKEDSKIKITIIEDNDLYSMFLDHKLKEEVNCTITKYESSEEFLKNMEFEKGTDIFILDYKLPGQNGQTLLEILKKKLPEAEIIIISSQSDLQVALDLIKGGAFDYIIKNNEAVNRLISAINRAYEVRFLRSENFTLKVKINKYKIFTGIIFIIFAIFLTTVLFL